MKTIALIVLLSMFSCGNALAGSFLTGKYEMLLIYGVHDEVGIPLKILEAKPIVATLDTEEPFIYNDGIHCSDDGKYVEGLCRFKDKDSTKWKMRFSGEPSSKDGYSIFTVLFFREEKRIQQIDFVHKGRAGDLMNMETAPFCISGLPCVKKNWFTLCLSCCAGGKRNSRVKMPDRFPEGLIEGNCHDSLHALHLIIRDAKIDTADTFNTGNTETGYASFVLNCDVMCSYKGGLKPGSRITFFAMWENYEGLLKELKRKRERIAFIKKNKKGFYYALNFGLFAYADDLDRALKAYAETFREDN
ncbi:MAG: hypothetical protein IMF18_00215 [Proteobacteria bacterium]|nr:hypothetical protein [Pseudomonadota bacterium]